MTRFCAIKCRRMRDDNMKTQNILIMSSQQTLHTHTCLPANCYIIIASKLCVFIYVCAGNEPHESIYMCACTYYISNQNQRNRSTSSLTSVTSSYLKNMETACSGFFLANFSWISFIFRTLIFGVTNNKVFLIWNFQVWTNGQKVSFLFISVWLMMRSRMTILICLLFLNMGGILITLVKDNVTLLWNI